MKILTQDCGFEGGIEFSYIFNLRYLYHRAHWIARGSRVPGSIGDVQGLMTIIEVESGYCLRGIIGDKNSIFTRAMDRGATGTTDFPRVQTAGTRVLIRRAVRPEQIWDRDTRPSR